MIYQSTVGEAWLCDNLCFFFNPQSPVGFLLKYRRQWEEPQTAVVTKTEVLCTKTDLKKAKTAEPKIPTTPHL